MDAKMLRDLFRSGDSYLVTSYRGEAGSIKEADNLILRALDALIEKDAREAAVEDSTDEIVRELRGQHCRDFGSDPQCDADGLCICAMHERAAAALVAERAAKEKAEAERDSLKRHAEAMAADLSSCLGLSERKSVSDYRRDHPKEEA